MSGKRTGVVLDTTTDKELERWAEDEQRSKRRQGAVLLRKLMELRQTNPDELLRLKLIEKGRAI
jgi:hypothetical protein